MTVALSESLRLPVMAAPMFIVSSLDLVLACCRAGVIGGLQGGTPRTLEDFESWIHRLQTEQSACRTEGRRFAPFVVNLLASAAIDTSAQQARLDICRKARVPLVLSTAGNPRLLVEQVHDWGGLVIHDVTTMSHARKAIDSGVDGLMLVCAGSGGHAGILNPFAFLSQVRRMFDGLIVLAGGIADGRGVAAALTLGADLVCLGTRFIATRESGATAQYRAMLIEADSADVLYTDAISGLPANFLRQSIAANGLDTDRLPVPTARYRPDLPAGVKPWKTVWSAGHSVGMIDDAPSVAEIVDRLAREFEGAVDVSGWRSRLARSLDRSTSHVTT